MRLYRLLTLKKKWRPDMSFDALVNELTIIDRTYQESRDQDAALASYRRLKRAVLRSVLDSLIPARWRRG